MGRFASERGFSLIESVVACALLAVGVLSLAQLFAIAASMNVSSKQRTIAAILAARKLEELRTAVEPAPGIDFVDARGGVLASSGSAPPPEAVYVRRWVIDVLDLAPATSVAVQVTVTPAGAPGAGGGDVRMASVRWRPPS